LTPREVGEIDHRRFNKPSFQLGLVFAEPRVKMRDIQV